MKISHGAARSTAVLVFAAGAAVFIACPPPPREKAAEILRKGMADESAVIRINAAKGYAVTGDRRGTEYLFKVLADKDQDKETIVAAMDALHDIGESRLSPAVVLLTRNDHPMIRTEAYRLIALARDTVVRNIMVLGTRDKIAKIRRIAFAYLGSYGPKTILRDGLRDVDPLTRIAAATALARAGEKNMENFIRRELDPANPNAEVWAQGAIALAEIGDTTAAGFLRDLLVDTPWDLRIAAAEALLVLKDRSGVETVKSALQSRDPFTRVKAVELVRRYPLEELYAAVSETTADTYINVSIGAVDALAAYHKKASVPVFEKLMNAPNPLLKIAAAAAYLSAEQAASDHGP